MKKEKKKPNKNAQERSERFCWRQMMGADRQTLKRGKGGALRRK
ncbi:hypothetical protein P8907_03675 [Bacillus atrophaeus]|nr:hypothetical protein [Bacillus atrophaeus]MEC0837146.1 hypothetical protein [Bacillus atrophaeus]MEC0845887.1 hypothetical protein [Bacillus atrophaeus]MEC0850906.1 hypothetical protein [Bacillus atrophaeus]MEC0867057.1 hypothetical protein [Bacillus atrophaeus]MEC0893591.1 hypothetical protein [Bacillus atrophaeus]